MAESEQIGNKFFERARRKASEIAGDNDRIHDLLNASKDKLGHINFEDSKISKLGSKLRIMMRMIKAYANGNYRELPWKSLLSILGAMIYFMMPVDFIPDFIPFTGLLDDFTIVMLISGAFQQDIEDFLLWEEDN
jgi:uncharacterized membrane protein YkvA (DUF1232 family)